MRPSEVAFIHLRDILPILHRRPELLRSVVKQLSLEYQSVHERLRDMGLGASIFERLAKFLLSWSDAQAVSQDKRYFNLPLTHQEIAEYVGATRESVTRVLGTLRRYGLIEGSLKALRIPDRQALAGIQQEKTLQPKLISRKPQMIRTATVAYKGRQTEEVQVRLNSR